MTELLAQMIRYAPGQRMPAHVDGERRLSILVSGELVETDCTREEHAMVGSVGLKGSRHVHESRFGEDVGATILSVLLPDNIVRAIGHDCALPSWGWHHSGNAALAALRLAAALRAEDADGVAESVGCLLARFSRRPASTAGEVPHQMEMARRMLHLVNAPSVEEIAGRMAMHPVSLGRKFHRLFGCSMTEYRQRERVAAVARSLLEGSDSLVALALEYGFSDASHMNRVFRRELGVSPGAFRRSLGQPGSGLDSFKMEWGLRI